MTANYQQIAQDFATDFGVKFTTEWHDYGKHFADDKQSRHIFKCRLQRGRNSYTFNFGQSIAQDATPPTLYDVLACLQKYDVGTFENFCADFGYNPDSRNAEKIYKAVCREWLAVERLFSDCLEELRDIN